LAGASIGAMYTLQGIYTNELLVVFLTAAGLAVAALLMSTAAGSRAR
jgi:hypothetical protein